MERVEVGNRTDIIFNLMVDLGFEDTEFAFLSGVIDGKLNLECKEVAKSEPSTKEEIKKELDKDYANPCQDEGVRK